MPTIGDAGKHSIFDDPSVERQARYVSAVLDVAKQHDALKQKRLKLESNYAAELERRAWLPLGAGGRALAGPMPDLQPHAWLPTELSELHRWIRQSARELSDADACAPVVPSGATDAELALEHAAAQTRCQLAYSSSEAAGARLAPVCLALLTEHERRCRAADALLEELPPLLLRLSVVPSVVPSGGGGGGGSRRTDSELARLAQLPPALSAAWLSLPGALSAQLREELISGGEIGGRASTRSSNLRWGPIDEPPMGPD